MRAARGDAPCRPVAPSLHWVGLPLPAARPLGPAGPFAPTPGRACHVLRRAPRAAGMRGPGGRAERRRRIDELLVALAATCALSLAATAAHEAGHVAVCASAGHGYAVGIGPLGPTVDCSAPPDPLWLYRAMGGAAGAASLAPLAAWGRLRESVPWRAGLAAAVYLQLAIMVIETAAHQMYMTSPLPTAAVTASSLLIVLSMMRPPWLSLGGAGRGPGA